MAKTLTQIRMVRPRAKGKPSSTNTESEPRDYPRASPQMRRNRMAPDDDLRRDRRSSRLVTSATRKRNVRPARPTEEPDESTSILLGAQTT